MIVLEKAESYTDTKQELYDGTNTSEYWTLRMNLIKRSSHHESGNMQL
jgi:hypothetical protein